MRYLKIFTLVFFCVQAKNSMAQCGAVISSVPGASGTVLFSATVSNTSTPSTYLWNFGDGTTGSGLTTSHTYSANGTFVATFTLITGSAPTCSLVVFHTVNVTGVQPPCNVLTGLTYVQGNNGQVIFNSTSTMPGVTFYVWNFGGTIITAGPNYTFTFPANGTYTVSVTAGMGSPCANTLTQVVTVNSYCNLNANFVYTQGNNGLVVLTNLSTGTGSNTVYTWNMGNSVTGSGPAFTYVYPNPGTYTITLQAANGTTCVSTATQVITITNTCVANANYSLLPSGTPKVWNAYITNPMNVVAAKWTWGDGTTSNILFTSHQYATAGTYSICLSVTLACGSSATSCNTHFVNKGGSSEMILVNVVDPSTVGLNDLGTEKMNYLLSPNPSKGPFKIDINGLHSSTVDIEITNILGEKISSDKEFVSNQSLQKQLDLSGAPQGIYFIHVTSENKTLTKKILIQE